MQCFGNGSFGQMGNGEMLANSPPVMATGVAGALGITAGSYHACARLDDGGIRCWGDRRFGQSSGGIPNTDLLFTPMPVLF